MPWQMRSKMTDYLLVFATRFEASRFLTCHPGESNTIGKLNLPLISGHIGNKSYDLLITGVGGFNAACALTAYLEQSRPNLIVQPGIAGVFKETGLKLGDLAIATREQYIHTGLETETIKNAPLSFDLIDGQPASREGIYPFDYARVSQAYKVLSREAEKEDIRVGKGLFVSVSTITSSFETAALIYKNYRPVMEAMEGAACAHVAALHQIPMIEIRAASNLVGEKDRSKWDMELAVKRLGWALDLI